MSNKQTWKREKALELRNAGMTYAEIALELGVSKQRASQYLATESGVYRKAIKTGACRYTGLREWMRKKRGINDEPSHHDGIQKQSATAYQRKVPTYA